MEKIWVKKELYKERYEFLNFMKFFIFYFDFLGIFWIYFIKIIAKRVDFIARDPCSWRGEHVAEPREATWTPTWAPTWHYSNWAGRWWAHELVGPG